MSAEARLLNIDEGLLFKSVGLEVLLLHYLQDRIVRLVNLAHQKNNRLLARQLARLHDEALVKQADFLGLHLYLA